VQPVARRRRQGRGERRKRVLEDADAMAAPVRLFLEQAGALERPLLERQLRGGAHLRLEFAEARKRLGEQLVHARPAVGRLRREGAHRPEGRIDDGGDERAAARKVAVGGRARHLGARRHLRERGHVAVLLDQRHRRVEQQAERRRLDAALGSGRRFAELMLEADHAGLSGAVAPRWRL
jgi:hypothetical protein